MATEICLLIDDDGKLYVSTEDKQAEATEGGAPEDKGTPVGSIDEALAAIKEMAQAGSMAPPPGSEEVPPAPSEAAPSAAGGSPEEEAAMMQSFQGGGR